MIDADTWQEILGTIRKNRLRTLLTALGVFWGMFMLVTMVGFGSGLERGVMRRFGGSATNAVFLWGGRTSLPYAGQRPGRWVEFKNADVALLESVPGVDLVAPRNQLGGWQDGTPVRRGDKVGSFQVMGDVPHYIRIQPVIMEEGRFVDPIDLEEGRKVAVIGRQVADALFDRGEAPLGELIEVQGISFTVVGVFRSARSGDDADRDMSLIHIPRSTFQRAFHTGDTVGWFAVTGEPEVPGSEVEARVRRALGEAHDLHPEDEPAIGSWNAEEEFMQLYNTFRGIRIFVLLVGTMTLLSGIFGVSNILLVVVRERTREIGLRRALGASRRSIMSMFVQEAVLLTAIAGYGGLVSGVALLSVAEEMIGPDHDVLGSPQLDLEIALGAGIVLVLAGAFAGLVPARRAAAIRPVEALRSE